MRCQCLDEDISPVQPLPLRRQASRPDILVKADPAASPVPDLQQCHVVPPVAARRGQRAELLVLQDDVHLWRNVFIEFL